MTELYRQFLEIVNQYLSGEGKEAATLFFDRIDEFWFSHNSELYYSEDPNNLDDEDTIIGDVWELVDCYDECDAIVASDPYCISESELRKRIIEMLPRINHPNYD